MPYTSAGCNFGAVATANTVLENTGTGASGDMTSVFGVGSTQWNEAKNDSATTNPAALRAVPQADFVGFAVHCAKTSSFCATGEPDSLPQEPGGYAGYRALFGAQQLNPILAGGRVLNDLAGNPIQDPFGNPGFPGSTACTPRRRSPTSRRCRSTACPSRTRTSRMRTTSTAPPATSTSPSGHARRGTWLS